MTTPQIEAIVGTLLSMSKGGPKNMLKRINFELDDAGITDEFSEVALLDEITSPDVNHRPRYQFHLLLTDFDRQPSPSWADRTAPNTQERRDVILTTLGFSDTSRDSINHAFPVNLSGTVVISGKPADWDPWYEDKPDRTFYWDGYRGVLEDKGWDADALIALDKSTDEVVKRLANPTREAPYQAMGLVVGHVQSGKTANFTGVIAKVIDSGYKLIIVLTGTIELLRSQTQRRLDMELIGEENILGGADRNDPEDTADLDYIGSGDVDWHEGKFVSFGKDPGQFGAPGIKRLTGANDDYKSLKAGLAALDFRGSTGSLVDPARPLYDEVNIERPDVRIAVVKKNSSVLKKLVKDLKLVKTDLGEIPTLIIDDEADQASINTSRPKKEVEAEKKERTAINGWIAEMLSRLKRAQYVGYTATPFANVFVSPEDSADIFPKDFIVSLSPPRDYMGGAAFHDLDDDLYGEGEEKTVANSNEKAFVRSLLAGPDDADTRAAEMRQALDAFVLSGAIKLHRAAELKKPALFRHHTMLVHESVKQIDHADVAVELREVWKSAGYSLPAGLSRLQKLWTEDFQPVTAARGADEPPITEFKQLIPFIGQAVNKIQAGVDPVVIVNGAAEKDYVQDDINFQTGDVWKILVGGAKLSRGFTVEGLTVSYYTRRTMAADTLMQMGRWFGYRPHYKDLVRLYIGRNVPGPRKTVVDLYKAFEAIVRDEEDFRDELVRFEGFKEDGRPKVRPMDIPPLVYQSLPFLKPTSSNKMYNAELTEKGDGGKVIDFSQQGERDPKRNSAHFEAVAPLLASATETTDFFYVNTSGKPMPWKARHGVIGAQEMIEIVQKFSWATNFNIDPYISFMKKAVKAGTLTDWLVIVPELSSLEVRTVGSHQLRIMRRQRRDDRPWQFSGSSTRQRDALVALSDGIKAKTLKNRDAITAAFNSADYSEMKALQTPTRGAFLLTFACDDGKGNKPEDLPNPTKPENIATLFSYALPWASAPGGRIGFTVRREDQPDEAIVDVSAI